MKNLSPDWAEVCSERCGGTGGALRPWKMERKVNAMSRNATIALVQMDCVMLDKEANLQKAKTFIEQAAQQHADLICFPEMFSTGYSPALIGPKYIDVAEEPDGPTFCFLAELAKKYSMYIVAPIVLKSEIPGLLYNGLIVISRNGQLMGTYNKTHLWAGERFWFRAGDRYPVFHMDFGTVGLMICYDGGFPEVSRILALSGAELILCPSAFPIRDKDMWDTYFGSRSLENAALWQESTALELRMTVICLAITRFITIVDIFWQKRLWMKSFCWYKPWIWTMWPITGQRMFPICRIAGWKPIKSSRRCIDRLKITAG